MLIFSKFIYRFNSILTKISEKNIIDIDKWFLQFMQKGKTNRVAKQILTKNKTGTIILHDFKASCQSKAINISRCLWGDGHADENEQRKKSPDRYGQSALRKVQR